jgi:hypothetical protein
VEIDSEDGGRRLWMAAAIIERGEGALTTTPRQCSWEWRRGTERSLVPQTV